MSRSASTLQRIDRALSVCERRDVEFVDAARATFLNILRKLRGIEKTIRATAKQYGKADRYGPCYTVLTRSLGDMRGGDGSVIGWYFAEGVDGKTVVFPPGIPRFPVTIVFERPHSGNARYSGVYLDYNAKSAGGMVKIVLKGNYTPIDFADPYWFGTNAASLFESLDSITVHELTHYFDTMRSKDHSGYAKSNAPGRKAFWDAPDGDVPDKYLLGNEEVNARFNEFVAACRRMMDLNAIHVASDYKVLRDAARDSGKTWSAFTGTASEIEWIKDRVYRSSFGENAAHFVRAVPLLFSSTELGYWNRTWMLLMRQPDTKKRMISRVTQLYADLKTIGDGMAEKIKSGARVKYSVKPKSFVVKARDKSGAVVKSKAVRYVHAT